MFVLIKKVFCIGSLFLSSLVSAILLSCISIRNQECKVRPKIADINSNNPIFYPFSIKINVVVIVIILMIHMHKIEFLIL